MVSSCAGIPALQAQDILDRDGRESVEGTTGALPSVFLIDEAPVIDGVFEEIWTLGTRLPDTFKQVDPVEGGPPSESTEVYVMRDSRNFYIAVRCLDSDPSGIRAKQMKRDGDFDSDDAVAIVIDPLRDRRTGYIFKVSAAGAKKDGRITGGATTDWNWDGLWYGRASIDEDGWTAELAIPFQTILANVTDEQWGLNVERFIRRRNETIRWVNARRGLRLSNVADAQVVEGFGDLDIGQGIDVRPFVKGSVQDGDGSGTDLAGTGGLDVFMKLPPSLTLALTLNNDFAETEVDTRQINFGRFPLFFPEKRDFFLEDSGIFNFGGIRRTPLPFYSRRIGIAPDGEEQGILAGAKLTGKIEDLNIGLMDVQMKESGNWKNYFVGRVLADVLEESTVGAIMTAGDPTVGQNNVIGGIDFNYRNTDFEGDRSLVGNAYLLYSDTTDAGRDSWAGGVRLRYPNDEISWSFGASRIGADYNAALGFNPRVGIYEYFGDWRYRLRPDVDWIRSIDFGVDGYIVTDLNSSVESLDADVEFLQVYTERGDRIGFAYEHRREVPDNAFTVADVVTIAAGDYTWDGVVMDFNTSDSEDLVLTGNVGYSGYYGGRRFEWTAGAEWRPTPMLVLGTTFSWNDINVQGQGVITRQLALVADFFLSPDVSLTNFIQYDNVSGTVGINSRLHWILEPGTDLYLVFNHNVEAEDLEFTLTKTEFIAKFGWTLRF